MTLTTNWTTGVRQRAEGTFPPEQLLPDHQPAYVDSWVYVFGVLTIGGLVMVVLSGSVLALQGPQWYHGSSVGLFVNSVHLWAVELFFFFMVLHLWGKYAMSAWRGKRALTWVTGAVTFVVSVATAFTGYVLQTNFDSQWISTQAKDGINATGIGAWFNVLDFGQMLLFHALLLPVAVVALTGLHVLLVRRRGVVPPLRQGERMAPGADPAVAQRWTGPTRSYDMVKEAIVALIVVAVLAAAALLLRSDRQRALAMLGAMVLSPPLLLASIWHDSKLHFVHHHPLYAAATVQTPIRISRGVHSIRTSMQ